MSRPASSSPPRDSPAQTTQQLGTRYDTSGIPGGGLVASRWVGLGGSTSVAAATVEEEVVVVVVVSNLSRAGKPHSAHFISQSASHSLIRSPGHGEPPLPARGGVHTRMLLARFTGFWTRKGAGLDALHNLVVSGAAHTPPPAQTAM